MVDKKGNIKWEEYDKAVDALIEHVFDGKKSNNVLCRLYDAYSIYHKGVNNGRWKK